MRFLLVFIAACHTFGEAKPLSHGDGVALLDGLGEDARATPVERAAEKKNKKDRWLEGERAVQTNVFNKWEQGGLADAAKSASIGINTQRENEWKAHLAGAPREKQGAYASGTYATDVNDWEKKLGGFPAGHIAKEKEEKVALKGEKKVPRCDMMACATWGC